MPISVYAYRCCPMTVATGARVLNCLRFDLPEIDFANVPTASPEYEAPAEQPSIAHVAPPVEQAPGAAAALV